MVKLLHTADWQLGLKLRFIAGDRGALARLERFEVVRRIAAVAKAEAVDVVLVAGDVLDDNAVGPDTMQRTADVLALFAPIPVMLLPGNHDAATAGGALSRLPVSEGLDVLLDERPRDIAGARFYPCPLRRRHEREDPTRHVPPRAAGDPIRVVVAHGGVLDFSESTEAPNRIDLDALARAGVDYVALGDWHGTLSMRPWAWYSGAPEATRFKEKEPGNILIVELDHPGATPRVSRRAVARTRWIQKDVELNTRPEVEDLLAWLRDLPERSWTLVELTLRGSLGLDDRAALDLALEAEGGALLHLRVSDDGLVTAPTAEDLARLGQDGWLGAAVAELQNDSAPDTREASRDALRLLHRLARPEREAER